MKNKPKHICDVKGEELFDGDDVSYTCYIRKIKTKGKIYYTKNTDTHFVLEDSHVRTIHLPHYITMQNVIKLPANK
jgi:hypothetical protein